LEAYAAHNPEIGYCQGMNFFAAFILMISGGKEKESFWFFRALLESQSNSDVAQFDGL